MVIDINLKGVYNVMQGFVSLLLKSKASSVINMALLSELMEMQGKLTMPLLKGGVIAMGKNLGKGIW